MSYVSPIQIIMQQIETQMETKIEDTIINAVQKAGICVDKTELLRALKFDRDQYAAGYRDGYIERDRQLVLCKDCVHFSSPADGVPFCKHIKKFVDADWFCADGEQYQKGRGSGNDT